MRRGDVTFVGLDNYTRLIGSATLVESLQRTLIFAGSSSMLAAASGCCWLCCSTVGSGSPGVYLVLLFIRGCSRTWWQGRCGVGCSNPITGCCNFGYTICFHSSLDSVYTSRQLDVHIEIVASVWQALPFATILSLGALQTVPQDIIEAAAIDGANRWQRFWRVILPICRSTLLIMVLLL